MMPKKTDEDGYVMGPLSGEETVTLLRAIDEHIGHVPLSERNESLRNMLKKHGRQPCKVVEIAKEVLPHRHPRSVYNFVRRRVVRYKTGRWSTEEVYILLEHYFSSERKNQERCNNDGRDNSDCQPTSGSTESHSSAAETSEGLFSLTPDSSHNDSKNASKAKRDWKPVSCQINRLPEQIHDKWKEMRPIVHQFRDIFNEDELSREEKIKKLAVVMEECKKSRITKHNTSSAVASIAVSNEDGRNMELGKVSKQDVWRAIHAYIVLLTSKNPKNTSAVCNIPWKKVCDHFTEFSESNMRLHWSLVVYPGIISRHIPGLNSHTVARCAIYHLRKNQISVERLSHVDFSLWIPQLPPLYVVKCVDSALKRCVNNYVAGKLTNVDVAVSDTALLTYEECTAVMKLRKKSASQIRSNELCSFTSGVIPSISNDNANDDDNSDSSDTVVDIDNLPYNVIRLRNGYLFLNFYRQIKLAYHEFQVAKTYHEDMALIQQIPQGRLLPYD